MIPIGLPSIEFVLICLALLLATATWLGWTLGLAISQALRQRLRGRWVFVYLIFAGVSLFTLWKIYDIRQNFTAYRAEQQFLFHPTLTEPQRLGAIDMPAGTQLVLSLPRQYDAFSMATFPYPIDIRGVQSLQAERYLNIQTDENYQTKGHTPENIRLRGLGHSPQEGWICDASQTITFSTHADGSVNHFESCTLAAGNQTDSIDLPAGAELIRTTGTTYLNGDIDIDRWLIHLPANVDTHINGKTQTGGTLFLDDARKLHRYVQ